MQAQRNRDLAAFVTTHLPPPPARVLEVGCGSGALARALLEAGYRVTAIDPKAPDGPPFLRVTLEELEVEDPFDAVVAAHSLHHLHHLPAALDRAAPASFETCMREWEEDEAEIHTHAAMRAELDQRFRERFFAWVPYLFLELGQAAPMDVEQSLIDRGAIQATGFRYVGETSQA